MFVNPALKDDYINVNSWPDDAVEVDEQVYIEFSGLPPKGKIRIAGENGFPAWSEIPPPTHEEQIAAAELKKQQLINQSNEYMNTKQWPGKAAIGRLKGEELAQYNLWLDYLDALGFMMMKAYSLRWRTARKRTNRSCRKAVVVPRLSA
nr:tail fiber assembly protein [Escherichia coli]